MIYTYLYYVYNDAYTVEYYNDAYTMKYYNVEQCIITQLGWPGQAGFVEPSNSP